MGSVYSWLLSNCSYLLGHSTRDNTEAGLTSRMVIDARATGVVIAGELAHLQ